MDNFVFANELELSIIEHRLTNLFELMDKLEVYNFYPAIIFNESFWQLPVQKRSAIISTSQAEWCGDNPINKSIFIYDPFFIDLIKSVKVTYFNYTKINLKSFLDILKIKNKFTVSEFTSFGSQNHNPLYFLNEIRLRTENYQNKESFSKKIFGKVSAINFYTNFAKKEKVDVLIATYSFSYELWESFFDSLQKIADSKKETFLKNINFTLIFISKSSLEFFEENINKYPSIYEFIKDKILNYEYIDINEFAPKRKYDYIFLDELISSLPTEILLKYGRDYYHQLVRITYVNRDDEKKALENMGQINSPVKIKIPEDLLNELGYEVTWDKYENQKLFELIEANQKILERQLIIFSITALKLIVNLIKNLEKNGKLEIIDYNANISKDLIFQDKSQLHRIPIFQDLYIKIIKSFEDLSIKISADSIDSIISAEIFDKEDEIITLEDIYNILGQNTQANKDFFDMENYTFMDKLKKISKKFTKYKIIKEKNFFFFGVGTLIYNNGLKKFYENVKKDIPTIKLPENLINKNLNSYEKEIIIEVIPEIIQKLSENRDVIISFNKDSKINEEIKRILKEANLKEKNFFDFINKYRDELSKDKAAKISNYTLITIEV